MSAQVKDGWTRLVVLCDECPIGTPPMMTATARGTGGGWWWGWVCPTCGHHRHPETVAAILDIPVEVAFGWPFIEAAATGDDWRRIGVVVI